MKILVGILLQIIALHAFAKHPIKLGTVGMGATLYVDGSIQIPSGQKLNRAAPSQISVFEKAGKDWILAEKIDLNSFFSIANFDFQKAVHLKSDKSEIKVTASLYHCPKVGEHGMCVIDDYEGYIKRTTAKVSTEVKVSLVGSPPPA